MKHHKQNSSTADLKELMRAPPISAEAHAAILRKQVEARRKIEDAQEAARQRRDSFAER